MGPDVSDWQGPGPPPPWGLRGIVRGCIEHATQAQAIPGQFEKNQAVENAFLLDKVSRLRELESRFPATGRAGPLVPVSRKSGNEDESRTGLSKFDGLS